MSSDIRAAVYGAVAGALATLCIELIRWLLGRAAKRPKVGVNAWLDVVESAGFQIKSFRIALLNRGESPVYLAHYGLLKPEHCPLDDVIGRQLQGVRLEPGETFSSPIIDLPSYAVEKLVGHATAVAYAEDTFGRRWKKKIEVHPLLSNPTPN